MINKIKDWIFILRLSVYGVRLQNSKFFEEKEIFSLLLSNDIEDIKEFSIECYFNS